MPQPNGIFKLRMKCVRSWFADVHFGDKFYERRLKLKRAKKRAKLSHVWWWCIRPFCHILSFARHQMCQMECSSCLHASHSLVCNVNVSWYSWKLKLACTRIRRHIISFWCNVSSFAAIFDHFSRVIVLRIIRSHSQTPVFVLLISFIP